MASSNSRRERDGERAEVRTPPTAPVPPAGLPPGRAVELAGRGTTWVHEFPGPTVAPDAPTLVLLHGWTVSAGLNWFTSMPALAERFRIVALDHRGHGRGIRSPRRFRLTDCADDVAALADVLEIESFIPVGYSMGGPIAQLVWKRHRDRVDGLVLCATSRNFNGQPHEKALFRAVLGLSYAARVTPAAWSQSLGERLVSRRYDDTDIGRWARSELARNDPRMVIEAGHAIGSFTSGEWIGGVDVPTAVVITTHDSVVSPVRQHKLAEAIPGATSHLVSGDHGVCVLDPPAFVPHLVAACESVATRAERRGRAVG